VYIEKAATSLNAAIIVVVVAAATAATAAATALATALLFLHLCVIGSPAFPTRARRVTCFAARPVSYSAGGA